MKRKGRVKYRKETVRDILGAGRSSVMCYWGLEGNETNESGAIIEERMAENFPDR